MATVRRWTKDAVIRGIQEIMDKACDEIDDLAERYRQTILIPFCKKHGLTFTAGMGTFIFQKGDDVVYLDGSVEDQELQLDEEDLAILNAEALSGTDCFAFHINDITEGDLKEEE